MTDDDMPVYRSAWDRLTYLLAAYKVAVSLAVAAAVVVVAGGWADTPDLPRWLNLYLTAVAVGLVPSTIIGKVAIVDRFMPDTRLKVAVVDPRDGVLVDVRRVTRGVWNNRERGKFEELQPSRGPIDHIVTDYEWNDETGVLTVEGCNPEMTDPTEIIAREGQLDEVYGDLMETRRNYERLLATLDAKLLRYDERQVTAMFEAVEQAGTFDSGAIRDVLDADELREEIEDGTADDRDPRDPDPYEDVDPVGERRSLNELLRIAQREEKQRVEAAANGHNDS